VYCTTTRQSHMWPLARLCTALLRDSHICGPWHVCVLHYYETITYVALGTSVYCTTTRQSHMWPSARLCTALLPDSHICGPWHVCALHYHQTATYVALGTSVYCTTTRQSHMWPLALANIRLDMPACLGLNVCETLC